MFSSLFFFSLCSYNAEHNSLQVSLSISGYSQPLCSSYSQYIIYQSRPRSPHASFRSQKFPKQYPVSLVKSIRLLIFAVSLYFPFFIKIRKYKYCSTLSIMTLSMVRSSELLLNSVVLLRFIFNPISYGFSFRSCCINFN